MNIHRIHILLIFIIVSYLPGFSQQEFLYHSGNRLWRLPYTGSYRQQINYGNDILEELAKDFLRPPRYVDVKIGFRNEISLLPEDSSSYIARITFSDFRLSGYLQYRSFPMSDVMMPSGFRFALKLSTKLDTGTFAIQDFEGKTPDNNLSLNFRTPKLAMDTAVDTLILGNFSFNYSGEIWQKFYAKKCLIDDYYASAAMLDSLDTETQTWDMRDPKLLPLNFIRLSELVRMLELISDRKFESELTKDETDFRQLSVNHLSLYKTSLTARFNLSETLDKSGALTIDQSPDSIADYFIGRLMRFIRLSSLMDNINGRIYQDYLETYYSKHVFENDTGFIRSVLIRMFPGAAPDTLFSWASDRLMKAYKRNAGQLLSEKRYSDAVMLMENARSMAAANPSLKDHNGWELMMSEAVNGIYNSYAGIASSSLEGENVNFALEYLRKAEEYREKYPAYITSDSIYRRVYRAILIGLLDHCTSLLDERDYADALDCLNGCEQTYHGKALEILAPDIASKKEKARMGIIMTFAGKSLKALRQDLPDSAMAYYDKASVLAGELSAGNRIIPVLDSLAPSIAMIRIKKINKLAEAYFRQRQFSRAILQFEQAGKISAAYSVSSDPVADSVYQQAYKQWLLDRLSREQRLIWSNKPDSVAGFLRLVSETAKSKGLDSDPDIAKALALYRSKITNQICEMAEDSLMLLNIRAGRCFAMYNYSRGLKILQSAVQQAGTLPLCNFKLSALKDSMSKYNDPAEYQNRLEEVNVYMAAGEYRKGLQILTSNEKFYMAKRIDHYGIPLTSVYDYVMTKANPYIAMQALDYYMACNEPIEALRYLMLLHLQGMPEDRSSMYQEKLAISLAAKDKLAYRNTDPQSIVRRYTSSSPWMRRFTEVYIESWKK